MIAIEPHRDDDDLEQGHLPWPNGLKAPALPGETSNNPIALSPSKRSALRSLPRSSSGRFDLKLTVNRGGLVGAFTRLPFSDN